MRNKLTPTAVHKTKRVGYHSDGGGLYLRVTRTGTRSWIFRWRDAGRLRDMGLGAVDCASLRTVGASLTAAREAAAVARTHVHARRDPIAERDAEKAARRAAAAKLAELALAHALRDKTEAAYMRSDLFEKRRRLMNAWAKHCHMPAESTVSKRRRTTKAKLLASAPE